MDLKQNSIRILSVKFPHYRLIRVLASLCLFLLLFCGLLGSAHVAYAAFTLSSPAQTETTITLSWSQSSDVWFYSYTLYESASVNGPYSQIWSTGDKGATSYGVSGLSSNTNYYFKVHDSGLLVDYDSNTLQVTTVSNPQLTVTSYDYSSVSLAWTDYNTYSSLEPFVSYTLQTSSSASGPWTTVTSITDPSQNSYRQMGLFHQTYWFQLYDTVGPSGNTEASFSNVANVSIPVAPTIVITASVTTLDAGQHDQFSSSTTGGVPPYTNYHWYWNGTSFAGATSSSFVFTPPTSGTYYIKASVQDTLGIPIDSNQIMVKVNTLPLISISASTSTLTVGQPAQFSSSTTGGATPYSYRWYSNGNPIAGATSSSLIFAPTDAGSYNIYATVQDYYNGTGTSNSIQITVTAPLAVNASVSTSALTVGQLAQFSVSASGGTPPYNYQWYVNGNPVAGANSSSFIFTPTDAGTYNIYATIQDNSNATASSNLVQVTATSSFSLPLSPMIIVGLGVIIIAIIVVAALVLRSRSRNKTQKTHAQETQGTVSDNQPKA